MSVDPHLDHQEHYRVCDCLADTAICCRPGCWCRQPDPWCPPDPDTVLVSLKEQWANIAAERLKEIERLQAELREERGEFYALRRALRDLLDD